MKPSLMSSKRKLERAEAHFKDVHAAVSEWRSAVQKQKLMVVNGKPKGDMLPIDVVLRTPPDLTHDVALAFGDGVHNLRSALDHTVLQMAMLGGANMQDVWRLTSFPIYTDPHKFAVWAGKLKKYLTRDMVAGLESVQPYQTAKRLKRIPEHAILWTLSELDNIDKHRVIVVIGGVYRITDIRLTVNNRLVIFGQATAPAFRPIKDGAIVATLHARVTPTNRPPKVSVNLGYSFDVRVQETGLIVERRSIDELGRTLLKEISTLINNIERECFT